MGEEYPANGLTEYSYHRTAPHGKNRSIGPAGEHRLFLTGISGGAILFSDETERDDTAGISSGICNNVFPALYRVLPSGPGALRQTDNIGTVAGISFHS